MIALRRTLPASFEAVDDIPGVVAYRRGDRLVAINLSGEQRSIPGGEVLLATTTGAVSRDRSLARHAGAVIASP